MQKVFVLTFRNVLEEGSQNCRQLVNQRVEAKLKQVDNCCIEVIGLRKTMFAEEVADVYTFGLYVTKDPMDGTSVVWRNVFMLFSLNSL